jgi:hypothetical protein
MFRAVSPDDYTMSTGEVATYVQSRTGRRPSPSTVFRWIQKGVGGVRLDAHKIGGRYYTGRHAVDDFLERTDLVMPTGPTASSAKVVTNGLQGKPVDPHSRREAERLAAAHEQAAQYLAQRLNTFRFLLCC